MPLRPISSMNGSLQHELVACFPEILKPILQLYSSNCDLDFFGFVKRIQKVNADSAFGFTVSCDIVSLFTIGICAGIIYRGHFSAPQFSFFKELMLVATERVEFSFNSVMLRQIDGVAMGSPLGPVLANIYGFT